MTTLIDVLKRASVRKDCELSFAERQFVTRELEDVIVDTKILEPYLKQLGGEPIFDAEAEPRTPPQKLARTGFDDFSDQELVRFGSNGSSISALSAEVRQQGATGDVAEGFLKAMRRKVDRHLDATPGARESFREQILQAGAGLQRKR
jgi:hypothetical protein